MASTPQDLGGKTVAVLATDGFEQSELESPKRHLESLGATVHVVAPDAGKPIRGWKDGDWGRDVAVDKALSDADPDDYDALVLPGGVINPDSLRTDEAAVGFIQAFEKAGKPLAAICHGPWLLAEAGIAKGRRLTSYKSIRTDLENAGARWHDDAVVVDRGVITSRDPDDLPAFNDALAKAVAG